MCHMTHVDIGPYSPDFFSLDTQSTWLPWYGRLLGNLENSCIEAVEKSNQVPMDDFP